MDTIIQIKNIYKNYGSLEVLKDVSLDIHEREIVSIVGASGAGKSTLLHIMGTLDNPDKGELIYKGLEIFKMSSSQLAKFRNEHLGFVFQFHHLLPEFSALENICIPAWIKGTSRKESEKRAMELLEIMHLQDRAYHKPQQLSGGEQQRVAVARALINNPYVVLADEPSGNLDSVSRSELHRLFFQLRDELNKSFVIVTHDDHLATLSDKCIRLKDGQIVNE